VGMRRGNRPTLHRRTAGDKRAQKQGRRRTEEQRNRRAEERRAEERKNGRMGERKNGQAAHAGGSADIRCGSETALVNGASPCGTEQVDSRASRLAMLA
jgi:hypothetical protein